MASNEQAAGRGEEMEAAPEEQVEGEIVIESEADTIKLREDDVVRPLRA